MNNIRHVEGPRKTLAPLMFVVFISLYAAMPTGATAQEDIELKQRGTQLRIAIDQAYQEKSKAHELSASIQRGNPDPNDITGIVVKYIPLGSSFDEAETILRYAGFKIGARPSAKTQGNRLDRYDVTAEISPYIASQFFSCRTDLYAGLTPAIPGDFSRVSKLWAGFTVSCL